MYSLDRRNFMKLAAASSAILAAGALETQPALAGTIKLQAGGRDFSPKTDKERKAIPSSCWQCVTRDSIIGYVEDGRLVKIEGNPNSIRTEGVLCAKGQAGMDQVYFPDRILYPMQRVGKRGEHKWKRISWDAALDLLASKLKPLRDAGTPELFMYQYGRHKASQEATMKDFMGAYGSGTIGNHTSICESAKWTAMEMTWGGGYDNWDFDRTDFVINFGSNIFEAHTNHIPTSHRLIRAMVDRGVPLYTFDIRLSNTAAKSTEWVPIKVNTDGAVQLAMTNHIMNNNLYSRDFIKFMKVSPKYDQTVDEKIAEIKKRVAKYTPEWAEGISSVPASKIKEIATGFAKAKSGVVITYRGNLMHFDGAENERASMLLMAVTNNLNRPGGRCKAAGGSWKHPSTPKAKVHKKLDILDGFPGKPSDTSYAYPTHHASHQVIPMIIDGSWGRPKVYWYSAYIPTYSNGNNNEARKLFLDEELMPFLVCTTIQYEESSSLADLILPDVTYLERWDWEDMASANQIGEWYFRQPLVKPLGEARCQGDVFPELAKRIGFELTWSSKEDYVKQSCNMTPGVKEAGGFEYMKKHGVWVPPGAKPFFGNHDQEVDVSGADLDEKTGVYSKGGKYVAQKIGDKAYAGFGGGMIRSGMCEFYQEAMVEKGLPAFPGFTPTPEHVAMGKDDLILTTFKVAAQTHSRTSVSKLLSELYHDNPGWMNPKTAAERGIKDGDAIKVKSEIGEITTHVKVTEGIIPGVIAISHHVGRKFSGRWGSGNKSPVPGVHDDDPDLKLKWWDKHGVHPNVLIPNKGDRVSGTMRWMDTVVQVSKA